MLIAATPCAAAKSGGRLPTWVIHVIPAISACPVRLKSGHFGQCRVYEYTAHGVAENKSLEIKTLRPRRVPRC